MRKLLNREYFRCNTSTVEFVYTGDRGTDRYKRDIGTMNFVYICHSGLTFFDRLKRNTGITELVCMGKYALGLKILTAINEFHSMRRCE